MCAVCAACVGACRGSTHKINNNSSILFCSCCYTFDSRIGSSPLPLFLFLDSFCSFVRPFAHQFLVYKPHSFASIFLTIFCLPSVSCLVYILFRFHTFTHRRWLRFTRFGFFFLPSFSLFCLTTEPLALSMVSVHSWYFSCSISIIQTIRFVSRLWLAWILNRCEWCVCVASLARARAHSPSLNIRWMYARKAITTNNTLISNKFHKFSDASNTPRP